MKEQQPQIGAPLHQLARDIALGGTGQLHFQAGEFFRQGLEAFNDRLIRHRLILRHAQSCLLAAHHRQRPAIEPFALAQHFPRFVQQSRAGFSEFRLTAAAAVEQADAQVFFQQRYRTADCRLRLALIARHSRKRTLLRYAHKQPQLLQIPLHAHGSTHLSNR
ncbi:hypothetical protein D9M73_136530 [compost metagenome]